MLFQFQTCSASTVALRLSLVTGVVHVVANSHSCQQLPTLHPATRLSWNTFSWRLMSGYVIVMANRVSNAANAEYLYSYCSCVMSSETMHISQLLLYEKMILMFMQLSKLSKFLWISIINDGLKVRQEILCTNLKLWMPLYIYSILTTIYPLHICKCFPYEVHHEELIPYCALLIYQQFVLCFSAFTTR